MDSENNELVIGKFYMFQSYGKMQYTGKENEKYSFEWINPKGNKIKILRTRDTLVGSDVPTPMKAENQQTESPKAEKRILPPQGSFASTPIQGCMDKIKQMYVSERKKIQLCSVLAGIENSNNEEAKLEKWYEFIDLFFNDFTILEEIYKLMKKNGLCFLNQVDIFFPESEDKHTIFVHNHIGKLNQTISLFNSNKYYVMNVWQCSELLMAIPISLQGKYGPHSNMLIIKKEVKNKETIWEVEHFEPHGRQYSEERDVNKAIDELVHDILKYDHEYNKDNVKITHPNQLCKLTGETSEILQQILRYTKYSGSCTVFYMWYSFNRLLYPEKESEQIYEEMNKALLNSKNPSETIENIILSFVSLIDIDIDSFEIGKMGNARILGTENQNRIKRKKNPVFKFMWEEPQQENPEGKGKTRNKKKKHKKQKKRNTKSKKKEAKK